MLKGQDASNIVLRQLLLRGRPRRASASTTCSPIRPSASSGRRSRTRSATEAETQGFNGRFGAGLPRINDGSLLFLQHMISKMKPPEEGGSRARDRLQRLAALHRGGRVGRVRDPPLDHRERLARGRRRAARPALLQHRHLHLLLGRDQPQGARAARQGPARRRPRLLREDAQVPRREAQGDLRRSRSTRSPASTASSRRGRRSRSSPTRRSASCGSPWSGRCGCAGRSPTRRSPLSLRPSRSRSWTPTCRPP